MADEKFNNNSLKEHNKYRSDHGANPLTHNKEISTIAQKWADEIAKQNNFSNAPPEKRTYKNEVMGVNMAMHWQSNGEDFTGEDCCEQWYNEKDKYNFDKHDGDKGCTEKAGNFTQMIWKDSKEVGFGKAKTADGKWFVVANYYPAGNVSGKYKDNVEDCENEEDNNDKSDKSALNTINNISAEDWPFGDINRATSYGTSVSRSIKTETSRGTDGKIMVKRIITETTMDTDGNQKTSTREEVCEGTDGDIESDAIKYGFSSDDFKDRPKQTLDEFRQEVLDTHNKYRSSHKVGTLKSNGELNKLAQEWADHLTTAGGLSHSKNTYEGKRIGENVASRWGSIGADYTGREVVDQWYAEEKKYDYERDYQSEAGHFSQVVWKNTEEMGVGKAFGEDGRVYVVVNYYPAGNILRHFKENVLPLANK